MNTCWKHLSLVCDSLCFPMKFKVGYAVACWLVCSGHYFVLWEKLFYSLNALVKLS